MDYEFGFFSIECLYGNECVNSVTTFGSWPRSEGGNDWTARYSYYFNRIMSSQPNSFRIVSR